MKKRVLSIIMLLILSLTILTGCSQEEQTQDKEAKHTIEFTDSLGRTVDIPKKIDKIAPCGKPAQLILLTLAPDKMVGLAEKIGPVAEPYIKEEYSKLPVFGAFYGKNANMNLEEVLKAKPEVLIDIGEIKKTGKEDMDTIQEQTKIPTIFIECTLDKMDQTYDTLGKILGKEELAKIKSDYIKDTMKEMQDKLKDIKKEKTIYIGQGNDGLKTDPKDSFHSEIYKYCKLQNVADIPVTSGKGEDKVSMEQVLKWNPDMVIFAPDSIYSKAKDDERWAMLPAIQKNNYYKVPQGPYNFIGRPPSVNRLLGIRWLATIAYPECFDDDIKEQVQHFYKVFYNYDLTDDQVDDIMENAL